MYIRALNDLPLAWDDRAESASIVECESSFCFRFGHMSINHASVAWRHGRSKIPTMSSAGAVRRRRWGAIRLQCWVSDDRIKNISFRHLYYPAVCLNYRVVVYWISAIRHQNMTHNGLLDVTGWLGKKVYKGVYTYAKPLN